jgi:hypothetical protein
MKTRSPCSSERKVGTFYDLRLTDIRGINCFMPDMSSLDLNLRYHDMPGEWRDSSTCMARSTVISDMTTFRFSDLCALWRVQLCRTASTTSCSRSANSRSQVGVCVCVCVLLLGYTEDICQAAQLSEAWQRMMPYLSLCSSLVVTAWLLRVYLHSLPHRAGV